MPVPLPLSGVVADQDPIDVQVPRCGHPQLREVVSVSSSLPRLCPCVLVLTACVSEQPIDTPTPEPAPIVGALVGVRLESQVGVLLDEIQEEEKRTQLTLILQDKPRAFWQDMAKEQVKLTRWRLHHRPQTQPGRGQLPLPPEESWQVVLTSAPQLKVVDGHDMMVVNYTMTSVLLTDAISPYRAEPTLGQEGGRWTESFQLPVDPVLLLERTGYACINESGLGAGSVEVGNAHYYYDDTCQREVDTEPRCHLTASPESSCRDMLRAQVGHVSADLVFERLGWDLALADSVRVTREAPVDGDLSARISSPVITTYRYVAPDSCVVQDRCVAGAGWRRLLWMDINLLNEGQAEVLVGDVATLLSDPASAAPASTLLEPSLCQSRYQVTHATSVLMGEGNSAVSDQWSLCLTSSQRGFNDESTPLDSPWFTCEYQGVSSGWASLHPGGTQCQWLDITDVPEGESLPLTVIANPDGLVCEGEVLLDPEGQVMWESTNLSNAAGDVIHKMKCDYVSRWAEDNSTVGSFVVPPAGEGRITLPCTRGELGPLRSCGFQLQPELGQCSPGAEFVLELPQGVGQVVRVCEASVSLGAGTSCTAGEALWNGVYQGPVSLLCPSPRENGAVEPGGAYVVYLAPMVPEELTGE